MRDLLNYFYTFEMGILRNAIHRISPCSLLDMPNSCS
jgi:hypothetical protein